MARRNTANIISNFFLSFVLDGFILNSGYIFYAIIRTWRMEGQVSIVPLNTNKAISGIIGAIFVMKTCSKDSKSVILWGSLLCATGIGLCGIAKDISWLTVFWGTVFGTGYGITSTYLQKELSASGPETIKNIFCKCAPNVGTIFFPFVLELLFCQYDLTGACLIVCGILLNYIPLSLLAFYNIKPRWKKFEWTMRKWSSKYKVNNQSNISTIQTLKQKSSYRNKILASCLESDIVCHKISVDNEAFENDHDRSLSKSSMEKKKNSLGLETKEIVLNVPIIETKTSMEMLEKQNKNFPNGTKRSQLILDIEKYENDHKIYEEDFYARDTIVNNDSSPVIDCLDENSNASNSSSDEGDKKVYLDSEVASNTQIIDNDISSKERSSTSCSNSVSTLSKSDANETPLSSVKQIDQFSPKMFKVNVLEYTFESESDYMHRISSSAAKALKKNNYRHHANSLITQCYDNADFTKVSTKNKELMSKNKDFSRKAENIYNIYEKDNYEIAYQIPKSSQALANEQYQNKQTNLFFKLKKLLKTLQLLANMECLIVLATTVIYEYIMATMVVMSCIFAEEARVKETYFKWIIAAFGAGGILGKFGFHYIDKNLAPRISITSAIFFMLNSLTIIGILWSSTLKWFINFYIILGILQSCIQASFSKIREIYIDETSNLFLSSACKLVLGLTILSLPYLIRFTTALSGDFELLLEILSCCSVFCAVFCFSLQKFPRSCFSK